MAEIIDGKVITTTSVSIAAYVGQIKRDVDSFTAQRDFAQKRLDAAIAEIETIEGTEP